MATSLYDLSVSTFLQTVTAVAGFLDRAAAHCAQTGADPDDFVEARLFADMAPFHFQIEATCHHAVWGVMALKTATPLQSAAQPGRPGRARTSASFAADVRSGGC